MLLDPTSNSPGQLTFRIELEAQIRALADVLHRLEVEVDRALSADAGSVWRGPAHTAFAFAAGLVRRDALVAIDAVRLARRTMEATVFELEHDV
jgi:hypothetical protein